MQPNESPEFSAMREALEEGGAVGLLGRSLGTFDNTDRRHRTKVFVLYVSQLADEYEDKDLRQRKWFSVDEAQKLLTAFKPIQSKYLVSLKQSQSAQPTTSTTSAAASSTTTTALPAAASTNSAPPTQLSASSST